MSAGVFRRLAAGCYDLLLLVAVWMLVTLVIVAIRHGEPVPAGEFFYQLLLLTTAALFFITSWVRGGQTLGMRAWRLRVETVSGQPLDLQTAMLRFMAGLCTGGLGLLWIWIDRDSLAWHDRISRTRVVLVPK